MILIDQITKSFNSKLVLDRLSLKIEKGETKVVIGRSGCGKSVLLKHLIGILKPDSGRIFIEDRDITELSEKELNPLRMNMAMVFQSSALFDSLTVSENVGFVLREHYHLTDQEILRAVKEALNLVE
ncbi:MAG: ATP-binding cassette domain-containing protein, partial [Candidatus Omnitrophica bacterium]|nr:ATP-binding cassette domain-containing protein [Candidatus Omnitrophota bacterium]